MGYNLYITRQENWFDENENRKISLDDWKNLINNDNQIRLDNFAEAIADGQVLRIEEDGLAVWTTYSLAGKDGNQAWFGYSNGNIVAKNPDKEIIAKLIQLSKLLNAKVQGDDGEFYDESYLTKKAWWQIW